MASTISLAHSSKENLAFTRNNYFAVCYEDTDRIDTDIEKNCEPYQYISSGNFPEPDEVNNIIESLED